jgi:hypothetical protein
MLSIASLMGQVIISQYLVTIRYGTGEEDEHGMTDQDKAFYAHSQFRSFYQLDQIIKEANFVMFSTALGVHLQNPGR